MSPTDTHGLSSDDAPVAVRRIHTARASALPRAPHSGARMLDLFATMTAVRALHESMTAVEAPADAAPGPGAEALIAAVARGVRSCDPVLTTRFDHAMALARGADLDALVRAALATPSPAPRADLVEQLALAAARSTVVTCVLFAGSADDILGMRAALARAAHQRLPVLFVCERNRFAAGAASERLAGEAAALNLPCVSAQGFYPAQVARAVAQLAGRIADGAGPCVLRVDTTRPTLEHADPHRLDGHLPARLDPIERLRHTVIACGVATGAQLATLEAHARDTVRSAVLLALAGAEAA